MSIKKLRKTIQYSVPSIAEIDMSSSGSGYERHLTNSLTTIEKEKNIEKKSKAKERNLSTLMHHDISFVPMPQNPLSSPPYLKDEDERNWAQNIYIH